MKTISFELSKRLNDLWLLENIKTKFYIHKLVNDEIVVDDTEWHKYITHCGELEKVAYKEGYMNYKTLTLEEACKFLVRLDDVTPIDIYFNKIWFIKPSKIFHFLEDLLNVEKLIEYLLDNNLLIKK
jgi:hypothetical protein